MAGKTIQDIVSSKAAIEAEIKELLSDFQVDTGCVVHCVHLVKSTEIGKNAPTLVEVQLEVHLPRR